MRKPLTAIVLTSLLFGAGCSPTVKVKHEVAPIFITVDVNIRVQKELEEFFNFEDEVKSENQQ